MTSLYSPEKHQSRRVLKRSNPLFIREMTHGASTRASLLCFPRIDKEKTTTRYLVVSRAACLSSEQRVLLRDFIGTRLQFSEQMSGVASTPVPAASSVLYFAIHSFMLSSLLKQLKQLVLILAGLFLKWHAISIEYLLVYVECQRSPLCNIVKKRLKLLMFLI
jgi:hypothetical protein